MEFIALIGIIIGLVLVCTTVMHIADRYFDYKEHEKDKENSNGN